MWEGWMSRTVELPEDEAPLAQGVEEQRKKRAYDIVKKAVRNSYIRLNNRSVSHRLLPGLWSATVNVLIACLEIRDVMTLLTNRVAALAHDAENAGSPLLSLSEQQLARYAKEVAIAGQAISESLDECIPLLEKEGLEDRLPESILDCAVFLLVNSWGPFHLRRAMVEQVSTFLAGKAAPALFIEPAEQIRLKQEVEQQPEPEPKNDVQLPLPSREEKLVRVFTDYRLENSKGEWAFAIHKTGPGNTDELHVMKGETADANGRSTPLIAIVEALKAVSHENPGTTIIVETSHEFIIRGMDGTVDEKIAFRHGEEEALWRDFDSLIYARDVRYKAVQANLSEHLQHICDMVMKRGAANLV